MPAFAGMTAMATVRHLRNDALSGIRISRHTSEVERLHEEVRMLSRVNPADPDRAPNRAWETIARSGAVFNINEG